MISLIHFKNGVIRKPSQKMYFLKLANGIVMKEFLLIPQIKGNLDYHILRSPKEKFLQQEILLHFIRMEKVFSQEEHWVRALYIRFRHFQM